MRTAVVCRSAFLCVSLLRSCGWVSSRSIDKRSLEFEVLESGVLLVARRSLRCSWNCVCSFEVIAEFVGSSASVQLRESALPQSLLVSVGDVAGFARVASLLVCAGAPCVPLCVRGWRVRLVVSGVCCVDSPVCFAHNLVAVPRFETEVVVRNDREDKEEGGKRSRVQRVRLQFSAEELDQELPTFLENTRKKLRAAVGGDVTFDRLYVKSGAVLGSPGLVACRDHTAVLFADERIANEGGWARKFSFIVRT